MYVTLIKPRLNQTEASEQGCEIIIPITIKLRIFLQPEVIGMPVVCHQMEQLAELTPESEIKLPVPAIPISDDLGVEPFPVEGVGIPVEIPNFVADVESNKQQFFAQLKRYMTISEERKQQIREHVRKTIQLSQQLLVQNTHSEIRKQRIMEHVKRSWG